MSGSIIDPSNIILLSSKGQHFTMGCMGWVDGGVRETKSITSRSCFAQQQHLQTPANKLSQATTKRQGKKYAVLMMVTTQLHVLNLINDDEEALNASESVHLCQCKGVYAEFMTKRRQLVIGGSRAPV